MHTIYIYYNYLYYYIFACEKNNIETLFLGLSFVVPLMHIQILLTYIGLAETPRNNQLLSRPDVQYTLLIHIHFLRY